MKLDREMGVYYCPETNEVCYYDSTWGWVYGEGVGQAAHWIIGTWIYLGTL